MSMLLMVLRGNLQRTMRCPGGKRARTCCKLPQNRISERQGVVYPVQEPAHVPSRSTLSRRRKGIGLTLRQTESNHPLLQRIRSVLDRQPLVTILKAAHQLTNICDPS